MSNTIQSKLIASAIHALGAALESTGNRLRDSLDAHSSALQLAVARRRELEKLVYETTALRTLGIFRRHSQFSFICDSISGSIAREREHATRLQHEAAVSNHPETYAALRDSRARIDAWEWLLKLLRLDDSVG